MNLSLTLYLLFVHVTLLVPGYALVKRLKISPKNSGIQLCLAYVFSIVTLASLSTITYVLGLSSNIMQVLTWLLIIMGFLEFYKNNLWRNLYKLRLPILCTVLASLFGLLYLSLSLSPNYKFIPDPTPRAERNYQVLNVKVLNISQTQANDNYIPYRQAQFFVLQLDPAKSSFIDEWSVHFFQRTPLMGAVTAGYFNLLDDTPPVHYTWSILSADNDQTYAKFQVIASVLNSIFIIPAYFLLLKIFNKKTAAISSLFFVISQFFIYNSVFSWPKSFVAFFILLSWLMLYEKRMRYTFAAGLVSGVAYLTHDLAVLYIGASILMLLFNRRIREIFAYTASSVILAVPWLLVSGIIFDRPSSFILYPLSLEGIPQVSQKKQIIKHFFDTSPLKIINIKLQNFIYVVSPYQLLTSEGGQILQKRLWAFGLFSLPGAIGISLSIAAVCGFFRKLANLDFWILAIAPIVLSTFIIGWPKGLGALHFAQASVVLLCGLGVAYIVKLKWRYWMILAYSVSFIQLVYFMLYSYSYNLDEWLKKPDDLIAIFLLICIASYCGLAVHRIYNQEKTYLQ